MSTYQGIRGLKVRDYTTNPDDPLEGQLWYNKTDKVGKYQVPVVTTTGAWRTANSINTARDDGYMVGAQTSALLFGGKTNPPPSRIGVVESYDGVSFTEVNDLNTARGGAFGGGISNTSAIAVGTSTSTLIFGGYPAGGGAPGYADKTESWNGSAWTEVGDLNLGRGYFGGAGASNALALGFGGDIPATPARAQTESWNGSAWTEVNDLNTARYGPHYGGIGTYIDTLCVGGYTEQAVVEQWNGSSWTEVADIATGRENCSAAGSNTNGAIMAGGSTSTTAQLATAQEWNNAVPVGAWSTSTAMNTGRIYFDGEVNNLNTARSGLGGAGTSTASLMFGGTNPGQLAQTESWNGSSWTEVADLNSAGGTSGAGGTSTSALFYGGERPGYTGATESWNGSAWTEVNDLNTARAFPGGSGADNTSQIAVGGFSSPPSTYRAQAETWNGSSWTEVNDLNEARRLLGTSGLATLSLAFGGQPSSPPVYSVAKNEEWNGASWVEIADLNVSRIQLVGTGTATSAIAMGGSIPGPTGYQATTEEWSGSTNSTKTIDTD